MGRWPAGTLALILGAACGRTAVDLPEEASGPATGGSSSGNNAGGGSQDGGTGGGDPWDTTELTIVEVSPPNDSKDVPSDVSVSVLFSKDVDETTLNSESFMVRDHRGRVVDSGSWKVEDGSLGVFTPASPLRPGTTYTASVTTEITDVAGNPLVAPKSWSFVTAAPSWSTAVLIGTDDTKLVRYPQAAMDQAGNAVAAWEQTDGTHSSIWANRFLPDAGWQTPTLIESSDEHAAFPDVAMDPEGNAMAVWQQSDGTHSSIWANRFLVGAGWQTPTLVELENTGPASTPRVTVDPQGNATAVWQQSDGTHSSIWANRFLVGAGWQTPTPIDAEEGGDSYFPQVTVDPRGNATAVWHQGDETHANVWANRFVVGAGWQTPTLIDPDLAGNALYPEVAMDPESNAVVVWHHWDGTLTNIWANRYDAADSGWQAATLLETDDTGLAVFPHVAMDPEGNATAVWQQSNGARYDIWARRYLAGLGWGTATRLETNAAGDAFSPRVAVDSQGNAAAVWSQSDGTRYGVWAARYLAGSGWDTATPIELNGPGSASYPDLAMNAAGRAVAVWPQSTGVQSSIWSSWLQ